MIAGYKLRVTCDDILQVFLDGVEQTDASLGVFYAESVITPAEMFQVIAFKCRNTGGPSGIVASIEDEAGATIYTTDTSWKCSSTLQDGWSNMDFNSESWPNAVKIADHGDSPWNTIGGISPDADWIWAPDNPWTVYCLSLIHI